MAADPHVSEIETLVAEIGGHLAGAHINLRTVWDEVLRTLEAARCLEGATSPREVAAKQHLCQALREVAQSLTG